MRYSNDFCMHEVLNHFSNLIDDFNLHGMKFHKKM